MLIAILRIKPQVVGLLWVAAITSMNQGSGVPVTIRYIQGERIEDCPFVDKRQQFEKEFEENIKEW